jgi:hypothetical protein
VIPETADQRDIHAGEQVVQHQINWVDSAECAYDEGTGDPCCEEVPLVSEVAAEREEDDGPACAEGAGEEDEFGLCGGRSCGLFVFCFFCGGRPGGL